MQGRVSPIGNTGKPGLSTPPTEKALTALRSKFAEAERRLMVSDDIVNAKARLISNEAGTSEQKTNRIKEETKEMVDAAQQLLQDCCDSQLKPYRELTTRTVQTSRFIQTLENQTKSYQDALANRSAAIESALQSKFNALPESPAPPTGASSWWNMFGFHSS
jgi:DNA repair exonuclease SbcCD ATPase subunit